MRKNGVILSLIAAFLICIGFAAAGRTVNAAVSEFSVEKSTAQRIDTASGNNWNAFDSGGMLHVGEDGFGVDLGVLLTQKNVGNITFNVNVSPGAGVQWAGSKLENSFSLFFYINGNQEFLVECYGQNWGGNQLIGTTNLGVTLIVGEVFDFSLDFKKVDEVWGVYLNDVLLEGTASAATGLSGIINPLATAYPEPLWKNDEGKTNFAISGHKAGAHVLLYSTKVSAIAEVEDKFGAERIGARLIAEDASGAGVSLSDSGVSETGYFFSSIQIDLIRRLTVETYGGVQTPVTGEVDFEQRIFPDRIVLGADGTAYDKTVVLTDGTGEPISDAQISLEENGEDLTPYFSITNHGDGSYSIKGVNKSLSVLIRKDNADKTFFISTEKSEYNVQMEIYRYVPGKKVFQTLSYAPNDDGLEYFSEKFYAGESLNFTYRYTSGTNYHANGFLLRIIDADTYDTGLQICVLNSSNKFYAEFYGLTGNETSSFVADKFTTITESESLFQSAGIHTLTITSSEIFLDGVKLGGDIPEKYRDTWKSDRGESVFVASVGLDYGNPGADRESKLEIFADVLFVENATFSNVNKEEMHFVAYDAQGNEYPVLGYEIQENSYSIYGMNLARNVSRAVVRSAGGVEVVASLGAEEIRFDDGASCTLNPVFRGETLRDVQVRVFRNGQEITRGIDFREQDGKIVLTGLKNIRFEVLLSKEGFRDVRHEISVDETDLAEDISMTEEDFSVILHLTNHQGSPILDAEGDLTVRVGDTVCKVSIRFLVESRTYLICGIPENATLSFSREGFENAQCAIDRNSGEITLEAREKFVSKIIVLIGEEIFSDVSALSSDLDFSFDSEKDYFICDDVRENSDLIIKIEGYLPYKLKIEAAHKNYKLTLTPYSAQHLREKIDWVRTQISDVSAGEQNGKWVAQEDFDALSAAISSAESAAEQQLLPLEYENAIRALSEAYDAFAGKVKQTVSGGCQNSASSASRWILFSIVSAAIVVGKISGLRG